MGARAQAPARNRPSRFDAVSEPSRAIRFRGLPNGAGSKPRSPSARPFSSAMRSSSPPCARRSFPRSSRARAPHGGCASGAPAAPRAPKPIRFPSLSTRSSARAWTIGVSASRHRHQRRLPQGGAAGAVRQMGPALDAGAGTESATSSVSDKDRWQVRPEFRSVVRFERHNLLSLLDGTSPLEFARFRPDPVPQRPDLFSPRRRDPARGGPARAPRRGRLDAARAMRSPTLPSRR